MSNQTGNSNSPTGGDGGSSSEERMETTLYTVPAGPGFRWGNTATATSAGLTGLLVLSQWSPEVAGVVLWWIATTGVVLGLVSTLVLRLPVTRAWLLKTLLRWRGWTKNPDSHVTRFYLGLVARLGGTRPRLFQLQPALPALPVPPLEQTLRTLRASVAPLLASTDDLHTLDDAIADFSRPDGPGPALQAQLLRLAAESERNYNRVGAKSLGSSSSSSSSSPSSPSSPSSSAMEATLQSAAQSNWLLPFWEQHIYLTSRYPLALYSNWYGADRVQPVVRSQLVRCANLLAGFLHFKRLIDTQELPPNRVQNTVPLCMWQYSRIFGTTREPGPVADVLRQYPDSKHVVCAIGSRYYRLPLYHKNKALSLTDIYRQLLALVALDADIRKAQAEKSDPEADAPNIAILTSQQRDIWAAQRSAIIALHPQNKESIHAIESALFVIALDDESPETVDELAANGMHRYGKPIWFDKNFNFIFFKNGRVCSNVEHTWSDASVLVHVMDYVFSCEKQGDILDWDSSTSAKTDLPAPSRLDWVVNEEIQKNILEATGKFQYMYNTIDLKILRFNNYGKGFIKKVGVSPDGFCQMAIQLAYYRLNKEPCLTYESAATVRFHHGRTETVRSCSAESVEFTRLMDDQEATDAQKLAALRGAVSAHVKYMRKATNGDGIDRHLFVLRCIAGAAGMKVPLFEHKALNLPFKLSTSQTPATGMLGGGFAPVAQEGYGVSYVVAEDRLWFHLTAYKGGSTSADLFANALQRALEDMFNICQARPGLAESMAERRFRVLKAN
eukprot:TRINITY_DN4261_c0_g5_i1.p1 TRINITY_DN4261_c0_g5~~TRINITY_DN4261_c0_g5_i1.p1  ORF type:complete len:829 (+),score=139.36 TRINITY_DN4261_c0_g5_i1:135-2489(+)